MARKLSLKELPLKGKNVLIRVDFNVPLEGGKIIDDTRIRESLPSIKYGLDQGGTPILISHLGRPKGEPNPAFSLKPVAKRLEALLGKKVNFYAGPLEAAREEIKPGEVLLLENIRFQPGEEKPEKDPGLVEKLKALGDVYVNDAFASSHRAHTSIVPLAKAFPGKAAAGFLLEKEIRYIGDLLQNPKKPFYALIGGSKISTKLGVLKSLLNTVDALFLGGGMVYTFLLAKNIPIGRSIFEKDLVEEAKNLLAEGEKRKIPIHLPIDLVVTDSIDHPKEIKTIPADQGVPADLEGVDIGPKTIGLFGKLLQPAKSVIWNGPFGVYEHPPFDKGTIGIANALASLKAEVIIGGGDSVAAVQQARLGDKMAHLSTGGGATLEYLEQGSLPGIEALSDADL
jgi:phosphoglycerate kinase